jgi:putative flippase GtrA
MLGVSPMRPWLERLFTHVPSGQFLRFIGVGVWNTVFGYVSFAVLAFLLGHIYPQYGYILAGVISSVVNISVAFFGYKRFVFRTKGNYLGEWMRCMVVYSSSIVLSLILLPSLVFVIHHVTHFHEAAPYIAGAMLACFNAIYNFLGNKKFTFSPAASDPKNKGNGS